MESFTINTVIKNNCEVVFDLCRSIDLHLISTGKTNEKPLQVKLLG